jgi:hypothetical protein
MKTKPVFTHRKPAREKKSIEKTNDTEDQWQELENQKAQSDNSAPAYGFLFKSLGRSDACFYGNLSTAGGGGSCLLRSCTRGWLRWAGSGTAARRDHRVRPVVHRPGIKTTA